MARTVSRRDFLKSSSVASTAIGFGYWSHLAADEPTSPNETLNIGCIGVHNRGRTNMSGVSSQNIVAICDIDENYLDEASAAFPQARRYTDFRKMLDREKSLDAVVVSTPDHTHAPASVWAMQLGLHCYCEKPLTHSVYEARLAAETAKNAKVATQMGTQIHATDNYRQAVEVIRAGTLGNILEVHVWVGQHWGGGERPAEMPEVPPHIHWDLWLGPAPLRPYHPTYLPTNWRRWWDFGQGTLGDMACHYMDLPYWALDLRHPTTVEAVGSPVHEETCPTGLIVKYEFPERDSRPATKLTWYDGNLVPKEIAGRQVPGSGVMFVGEKGQMYANYSSYKLYPEDQFNGFTPPEPTIPRSIGHYNEWIKACKDGSETTCNFDYSGALTEAVLLGNVAYRSGKKLEWDAEWLVATNCLEAARFIRREYRQGWTL
jgi:predicted dehydrogenase